MDILDILRYLRGYIEISVQGGFTERFINLCNRENVYLWDSVFSNGVLSVKLYCRDFKKLTGIRRKSGVKIKIEKKNGLHFFMQENRKRKILAVGIASALVTMLIMNNFVWSIDVTGTESIGKNEIREILKENGLKYGTFVPAFDESKAGRDAVNLSEGKILWLAVNIKGSKATVEVRDYIRPDEQTSDSSPCNIVADFEGIILSAYTYRGVRIAQVGAAVKKGDLLISGITESENSTEYLCADGEIIAMHMDTLEVDFTDKVRADLCYGLKKGYRLKLFGADIPLNVNDNKSISRYSYTKYLTLDGNIIPIGIEKDLTIENNEASEAEQNLLTKIDIFTENEYSKFKNTTITNADYRITQQKDGLNITGTYSCIDFMGIKSPLLKEN